MLIADPLLLLPLSHASSDPHPTQCARQCTRIIGWGIRFKLQMLCPQEDE